jgi:hypothetical protein
VVAACTTTCTSDTDCTDSTLPLCQNGLSTTYPGKYCTATGVACGTK